jgi:hypothetical protein
MIHSCRLDIFDSSIDFRQPRCRGQAYVSLSSQMSQSRTFGVLGPTARLGLPLEVLFGVGWCYRLYLDGSC